MNAARFQALHTAHGQGLLAYFVRRIPNRDDAADLLAETYLILWRRITDLPAGEERAWLYTVARNVLANHHRGTRRRLALADRLRADLAHTPPQPVPTEHVLAVRSALAALPHADRELLTLTGWDGLTTSEAATVLGIRPDAARARLARARRRLRAALGEAVTIP